MAWQAKWAAAGSFMAASTAVNQVASLDDFASTIELDIPFISTLINVPPPVVTM